MIEDKPTGTVVTTPNRSAAACTPLLVDALTCGSRPPSRNDEHDEVNRDLTVDDPDRDALHPRQRSASRVPCWHRRPRDRQAQNGSRPTVAPTIDASP